MSENTLLASFELFKFILGSRAMADGNKTNGNGSFIPESQMMLPLLLLLLSLDAKNFSFSDWLEYV